MYINGIFEGGGIKGLAYIGVMRFLEERGFRFYQVGGTSVGSLFAALIAAGYTSKELEEIINNFDIQLLIPQSEDKKIVRILKSVKSKGIYSIDDFEKYLFELLKNKGKVYFKDVKFGDKYMLKMVATELTTKKMIILPDDLRYISLSSDKFLISKAVAMSSNIPFFYSPYKFGKYIFVDGGVTNNFPIKLFIDSNIPTIGFRLSTTFKSPKILTNYQKKIFKLDDDCDLNQYNVIEIDTLGIKATDFKKGIERKEDLYNSGYQSIRRFFYNSRS